MALDETRIKSKRPIGITILAALQMWIGIGSIVLSPITGSPMWLGGTAEKFLHAHHRIRPFAILAEVVFLIIYAGIGLGLWKLRSWARKAEIGLIAFCTLGCIVGDMFDARPLAFALLSIVFYAVGFGCIIWYLMRPRVRAAFTSAEEVRRGCANAV